MNPQPETRNPQPEPAYMLPLPAPDQDQFLYRLLIGGLIAAILLVVIGTFVLAYSFKPIPEGMIAIGSAAVGGLVGLLVPSPVTSR